jgi:hypothetical protein
MSAIIRRFCSSQQDIFAISASNKLFLRLVPIAIHRTWQSFPARPSSRGTNVFVSQAKQINDNFEFAV